MPRFFAGLCCGLLLVAPLHAARVVLDADNTGALTGTGRTLSFNLPAVSGEIRQATLQLSMNYSAARDLRFLLSDAGDTVQLPLGTLSSLPNPLSMNGEYRINDLAISTWLQEPPTSGNLPTQYPVRAFQFGPDGQCLNLLARYLEFDFDRQRTLQLRVERLAGGAGLGSVSRARLILETEQPEALFASGLEEPATPVVHCKRPAFDLVFNGGRESFSQSGITLINFVGGLDWWLRLFDPPIDFGPVGYGSGNEVGLYPGRFGGRSRINIGFWDPVIGTLNFTTGSGGRTLVLEGDWVNTFHIPIPGDYDGDGTTDLAMAFLGGDNRWLARILFSRSGVLRDYPVDPRISATFSSGRIGFGQGQDADRNGRDEITQYAQISNANPAMSYVQWLIDPESGLAQGLATSAWGLIGDRMVLGKWSTATSGNQFSLMVVRKTASAWEWYVFGNGTPTVYGLPSDYPLSINVDFDSLNDIAVFRPSDQTIRARRSTDGVDIVLGPFGPASAIPLGYLLGTTAPLEQ